MYSKTSPEIIQNYKITDLCLLLCSIPELTWRR